MRGPLLPSGSDLGRRLHDYGPGLVAAVAFAGADIFTKLALAAGTDVLTIATVRSLLGVGLTAAWIALGRAPVPLTATERGVASAVGVLYAGIIFCVFKAIELLTVPMAILTYFSYPLVTGIAGALLGVEKLGWRGLAAAAVAFAGLALTIGANPGDVSLAGIAYALAAAACRVAVLLVSRVWLLRADARLSTWYSGLVTTALFCVASLVLQHFVPPVGPVGWLWVVLIGVTTTTGVAVLFVSTTRIGPFLTALTMNLEPLLATVLSALFLGELFTPVQALGAAVMIASLFAFQLRR